MSAMAKEKGRAKIRVKDLAEPPRLVGMQGQETEAVKGRRQKAEGSKEKGKCASAKGRRRRRGQAHLPNFELDDWNCPFLIERLSKLD